MGVGMRHRRRRTDYRSAPIDIRYHSTIIAVVCVSDVINRVLSTRVIVSVVLIILFQDRSTSTLVVGYQSGGGSVGSRYKNDDSESNERSSFTDSLIASGFCRHTMAQRRPTPGHVAPTSGVISTGDRPSRPLARPPCRFIQ